MQTEDGCGVEPHSTSAGLDYPGIGPHIYLKPAARFLSATTRSCGCSSLIFKQAGRNYPALESSLHALARLINYHSKQLIKRSDSLGGRGDKDLATYMRYINKLYAQYHYHWPACFLLACNRKPLEHSKVKSRKRKQMIVFHSAILPPQFHRRKI